MKKNVIIKSYWDNGTFEMKGAVDLHTHQIIESQNIKVPSDCYSLYREFLIMDGKEYEIVDKETYERLDDKDEYYWYELINCKNK